MKPTTTLFLLNVLCGLPTLLPAQHVLLDRSQRGDLALTPAGFEENKGQVVTTDGQPAPFVRFRLCQGGTSIFLLDGGIAYQFSRTHLPEGYAELRMKKWRDAPEEDRLAALAAEARLETYRMDMILEGADPAPRITTEGRSADHTHYYNVPTSGPQQALLDVHSYSTVTYHAVYPGIDWVLKVTDQGFEYDFIVQPGADPGLIRMRYTHQEELFVDDQGQLIHGNRLGRFTEQEPVSFQDGRTIFTAFRKDGDRIGFDLGAYDRERPLVIDPPRLWGTYYGGTMDDYAQAVAVDASGNVFLGGYTKSTSAIATAGAHQTVWVAEDDAMLVKFNANGVRQWGTYYGGSVGDAFSSLAVDASGNIYAAGITKSTASVASTSAHQTTLGGDWDALLVKFNTSGVRQWGTYYGGPAEDRGRACSVDGNGNVYMTGITASVTAIATAGSHQPTNGGFNDTYLVKFNTNGVRQWGTYYGGGSDEDALGCDSDASGNTCIAGGTGTSTGTSIASAGSHQPIFGGPGSDGFLAKFNTSGVRQWGTYYGGSTNDFAFSCAIAPDGSIYVSGDTQSSNGISTAGAHQVNLGGGTDAFLAKFNSAGVRQWGTYYGGGAGDFSRGCQTDANGNGYLVGETESSTGIATADAHQPTFGGAPDDAYLARFLPTGIRDFGTYYGGLARDNGYNCAVDANGNIFLVGETLSDNAISASGHQGSRGGGFDAYLVKFGPTPLTLQMYLQGPWNSTAGNMNDGLRSAGLIPAAEPYTALGFAGIANAGATIGTGVLTVTGTNAVVDWVLLEARNATTNAVLKTWALLLQRDGDVMMPNGATLSLEFPATQVRLAVRHRNHFGCLATTALTTNAGAISMDFRSTATPLFGTEAETTVGASRALWAGDVTRNGQLKYTGSGNDRDPVLIAVGSTTPNSTVTGYRSEDVNMDGTVKYTGSGNDRDPILVNVGSTTPNNVRAQQLP